MQLKDAENRLIFQCVAGSHAYGTAIETSDTDLRGVFYVPPTDYFCLNKKVEQVSDSTNDTTYYTIMRFLQLAAAGNPNIIELLWVPKDCVKQSSLAWGKILQIRNEFITKSVLDSFGGYAVAQIKKARGQNKLVHNPMPEEKPLRWDFCWFKSFGITKPDYETGVQFHYIEEELHKPFRLEKLWFNPIDHKCSAVDHIKDCYRLYYLPNDADRGIFSEDGCNIITKDIPIEKEREFVGILVFHKEAYESALKKWHQYWDWKAKRNEARWVDQEKKAVDFDGKNMMHCMRLLYSGENILANGEPLVRLTGDKLQRCRDIRAGVVSYDEILAEAEERLEKLDAARKVCSLRTSPNFDVINDLSMELHQAFSNGTLSLFEPKGGGGV